MSELTLGDITAAAARIAPHVIRTPLLPSRALSDLLGTRVSIKYEFLQETSSFKPRGAFNKILTLSDADRARGLLAVSGGNHGKGVAFAARQLGLSARIIMFETSAPSAVAAARAYGAQVDLLPSPSAGFARAHELEAEGYCFIHPFDDVEVAAGQGTLGLEIIADAPDLTDVIASIGGGGMIGGAATAIKESKPATHIWGVETVGADAMSQALAAGKVVQLPKITSIAATLGAPSASELTLALAQRYLEEVLVRPDAEAVSDMVWLLDNAKVLVEPAAAVTVSAARQLRERLSPDGHLVIILCGASISLSEMSDLRERFGV